MDPRIALWNERLSRRSFLSRSGAGVGRIALASLLANSGIAGRANAATHASRAAFPRAKRVIHLCMAGGPSHLETLDYKPELARMHGKPMPKSFTKGEQIAQLQGRELKVLGPQHPFQRWGSSGQEISTVLPEIGKIADRICILRSLETEQINHDPAHTFMNTGTAIPGRPSMGSWINYGLGSECEDLPGFVVLTSLGGGQSQPIAARQWHSGFLPSRYQGVRFQSKGEPVLYLESPPGVNRERQKDLVDTVARLNRAGGELAYDPELETRVRQYELAFRMQASVPELLDLRSESQSALEMYGARPGDGTFATNCLLARRLVERGVRFVQLYHRGWDHHGGIKDGIKKTAGYVDKASAALVRDLEQRGLLDETLIVWGGEFGRTPMAQGNGRDHHIRAFSMWLAGGGIRGGMTYGSSDEFGYGVAENRVHVHDLHATLLHLLGIDHTKLTYRYQGRDFRLTDVAGELIEPLLA
ncbi:MAG: DUF1501 domain-containing protein [Planctomycetota bacterium]